MILGNLLGFNAVYRYIDSLDSDSKIMQVTYPEEHVVIIRD